MSAVDNSIQPTATGTPEAAEADARANTEQLVAFHLAGELYAVDVLQVQEILRIPEITPVPGAPAHIPGIINLRGHIVTVIDTRRRLGLPERAPDELSRILVVNHEGGTVGIMVDSVEEVMHVDCSVIEPVPDIGADISRVFLRGVVNHQDSLLILVALDQLVATR